MADFYENEELEERVILVGVQTNEHDDTMSSLKELDELARTAGAEAICKIVQNLSLHFTGYLYRKGKDRRSQRIII